MWNVGTAAMILDSLVVEGMLLCLPMGVALDDSGSVTWDRKDI